MRKAVAVSKSYDELNFCSSKDLSGTFDDLYKRRAFSKSSSTRSSSRSSRHSNRSAGSNAFCCSRARCSQWHHAPAHRCRQGLRLERVNRFLRAVMLYMQPYNETDKTDDDPDLTQWRRVMNYLESNKCNRTDLSTRLSTIFNLTFGAVIVSAYMEKYEDAEEVGRGLPSRPSTRLCGHHHSRWCTCSCWTRSRGSRKPTRS